MASVSASHQALPPSFTLPSEKIKNAIRRAQLSPEEFAHRAMTPYLRERQVGGSPR